MYSKIIYSAFSGGFSGVVGLSQVPISLRRTLTRPSILFDGGLSRESAAIMDLLGADTAFKALGGLDGAPWRGTSKVKK